MLEDTIRKIQKEQETGNNEKQIGEYLLAHLKKRPADEALIGAEGKSLTGCMKYLKEKYEDRAAAGVAIVSDEEVYADVRRYYGIEEKKHAAGLRLEDLL